MQILELKDRKDKLLVNIGATKQSIIDFQERLDSLVAAHGDLTDVELQKMIDAV